MHLSPELLKIYLKYIYSVKQNKTKQKNSLKTVAGGKTSLIIKKKQQNPPFLLKILLGCMILC